MKNFLLIFCLICLKSFSQDQSIGSPYGNIGVRGTVRIGNVPSGSSSDSSVVVGQDGLIKRVYFAQSPFVKGVVTGSSGHTTNIIHPVTLPDSLWAGTAITSNPPARYNFNGTVWFGGRFSPQAGMDVFGTSTFGATVTLDAQMGGFVGSTSTVAYNISSAVILGGSNANNNSSGTIGTVSINNIDLSLLNGKRAFGLYGYTTGFDNGGGTSSTTAELAGVYGEAFSPFAAATTQTIYGVVGTFGNRNASHLTSYGLGFVRGNPNGGTGASDILGGLYLDSIPTSLLRSGVPYGANQIGTNSTNFFAGNTMIGDLSPTSPDASAKFEVATTTKGSIPFPPMTQAQRLAIPSPKIGLHVYQTDGTEGVYVNKSTGWQLAY